MANKKGKSTTKNTSKSKSKKKSSGAKVLLVFAILLVVVAVGILAALYFTNISIRNALDDVIDKILVILDSNKNNSTGPLDIDYSDILEDSNVQVHFLELGNKYTGDCTLIKCGDVEVLIDAGSRKDSSKALTEYIDQYCSDGKLEYVIATHAHQDHIAGFVGSKANPGIFDKYECEVIIDFPLSKATSQIAKDYAAKRDAEVAQGAKHYTALECYNNENGATRDIVLGEGVILSILNSYYYTHYDTKDGENNYSVSCLLNINNKTYCLFTGDLEIEGESYLVDMNDLPKCKLFKGGHHGSYTASSEKLLSVIQPEIVCVCCCAGTTEYTTNNANTFPSQPFIDRVTVYTTNIYVTTLIVDYENNKFESLNGNIMVLFNPVGEVAIKCSNNNTKLVDTEWFKKNRTLK